MSDFQKEKNFVREMYKKLDAAVGDEVENILSRHISSDYIWYGYNPFNELKSAKELAEVFWLPLKKSFRNIQRREDVFMAGRNQIDDFQSTWVVSMGHLMGLFDAPWLGIKPTGKMIFLRYCEFSKVENNRIKQTAMFFDIPHVMMQCGLKPFPTETGAHLVQPGPLTHHGLMFELQDPKIGEITLQTINAMITDLGQWNLGTSLEDELRRTWCEDMIWWGPAGIGATYTIDRYVKQHSGPFRNGLSDRSDTNHVCRLAEGHYGGFFGWPNFTARPTGGFMGMPATDKFGEFRVIDIYRRRGNKLAENWVFIDLLHFWKMQGVDILERTKEIR